MFGPAIKKYLVANSNDGRKHYYQAEGLDSGIAKCPTNPKKNSEVACKVGFSLQNETVSLIRVVCSGPPALTASGNYVAKEARGKSLDCLINCSRVDNMSNILEISPEIANSQGLWVVQNAVDAAVTYYNSLNL